MRAVGRTWRQALLWNAGQALAQPPVASSVQTGVTVIRAGRLVDATSGQVLSGRSLMVQGGRITAVQPIDAAPPAGAQVIDLSRETVLPGLIDVHVHLTGNAEDAGPKALTISIPDEAINGVANARKTLMAGFTTARNVGASHYTDVALRNAIDLGKVVGAEAAGLGAPARRHGRPCRREPAAAAVRTTAPRVWPTAPGRIARQGAGDVQVRRGPDQVHGHRRGAQPRRQRRRPAAQHRRR